VTSNLNKLNFTQIVETKRTWPGSHNLLVKSWNPLNIGRLYLKQLMLPTSNLESSWRTTSVMQKMQIRSKRAWPGSRDLLLKFWNSFNFSGMAKVTKLKFGVQLAISVWMKRHTRYETLFLVWGIFRTYKPSCPLHPLFFLFSPLSPSLSHPSFPFLTPSFPFLLLMPSPKFNKGT